MKDDNRCPEFFLDGRDRKMRCQKKDGHDGRCSYHRASGQGGTLSSWWGANSRPVGHIGDLGYSELYNEVLRLRRLCEENGIDWKEGLEG